MGSASDNPVPGGVADQFRLLEARLARIEERLGLEPFVPHAPPAPAALAPGPAPAPAGDDDEGGLEFRIGQYWLAQAGIIALVIGIAFLLTFPFAGVPPLVPLAAGYGLAAALYGISLPLDRSSHHLARCLVAGALFLLYFATLRLNFFTPQAVVSSRTVELALLWTASALALALALRAGSGFLVGLSLTLGYVTALLAGGNLRLFAGVLAVSVAAVALALRHRWGLLHLHAMLAAYLCHAAWALNNPLLGNPLQVVTAPGANLYFLLAYMAVFAAGILLRPERGEESDLVIVASFLNAAACYGLFLLISVKEYGTACAPPNLLASAAFLAAAVLAWRREQSRYATFFYAMTGYAALTVGIIALSAQPEVFIWLCWQSLLVIATAVWFRSKFIVLANFFIFVGILLAYVIATERLGYITLSFGAVALVSARILNWQQHRLHLRTQFMRTVYLVTAFVVFPYALWHLVPRQYVSLSWMGVALAYYVLSLALHNAKYRWMALLTLLLTVAYLFVIGTTQLDPAYRIVSFIALGLLLLAVSLAYTRTRKPPAAGPTGGQT